MKRLRPYGYSRHFSTFIAPAFGLLIFSVLGVYFLGGSRAATVNAPAAGSAQLVISPATTSVAAGQPVKLTIELKTDGQRANATQANVSYPADSLEYVRSEACQAPFGITAENRADNGTVTIACGSIDGIDGQAKVATVTFKAKRGSGKATVSFGKGTTVLSQEGSKNILGSTGNATINFVQ